MSAQTRKLEIIERVLHLEGEESLALVEQALEMLQTNIPGEEDIPIMPTRSKEEIARRLTQSLADMQAGHGITSEEMRARAQQWRGA